MCGRSWEGELRGQRTTAARDAGLGPPRTEMVVPQLATVATAAADRAFPDDTITHGYIVDVCPHCDD
jgi:hypothetical protein